MFTNNFLPFIGSAPISIDRLPRFSNSCDAVIVPTDSA